MKLTKLTFAGSLIGITTLAISGVASALATTSTQPVRTTTAASTASDQAKLKLIVNRGDQEIHRRLTTLGTLTSKINGAAKLSSADKATLSGEVSSETSGLTALKTKLDAETTVDGARADAQSIFSDYRVYALIVPKVQLVRVADDQQVVEGKLTALATKLQTRLSDAQGKGKDVSSLQAKLTDLNTQVSTAQAISSSIEAKVINLQPSDYNSDHTLLSGDAAQLRTAHTANVAAATDARTIISGLKSL